MSEKKNPFCIGRCPDCGVGYFIFLSDGTYSDKLFSCEEGLIFLDVAWDQEMIAHDEKEALILMILHDKDLIDTMEEASVWLESTSPLSKTFDIIKWLKTVEQISVTRKGRKMLLADN